MMVSPGAFTTLRFVLAITSARSLSCLPASASSAQSAGVILEATRPSPFSL